MIVGIYVVGVILMYLYSFVSKSPMVDINIVWPLFIASFGIDHWFRQKNLTKIGMIFVYIGMFYLFMNIGLYDDRAYKYIFLSFILVMLVTYLLQNLTYSWRYGYVKSNKTKRKVFFTLFGSKSYIIDNSDFGGLIAINIFGGLSLDLTNAKLGDDKVIVSLYSFCGESSITLPKRVNIVVIPSTLFGDTTIETKEKNNRYKKVIFVKSFSLLCSTDIQNKEIKYDDVL